MFVEDRFAQAAREAATAAAAVCRSVQQNLGAVRTITKDDRSPVTVADLASQAVVATILLDRLGEEFAGSAFVAEEDASFLRRTENAAYLEATLQAVRRVLPHLDATSMLAAIDRGSGQPGAAPFWTLDPIDGTKGFLRGEQYAVALALVDRGAPVMGVLACPNLPRSVTAPLDRADVVGSLYLAVKGGGAQEFPCDAKVSSSSRRLERLGSLGERPLRACASVEKAHSSVSDTDRVLRELNASLDVVRVDSSAKYALVARGQADAYLRLPTRKDYVERIWDHAAGAALATEAGCVVSDIHGRALDFGHGRGLERNKGVIVARAGAHERIVAAIAKLGISG